MQCAEAMKRSPTTRAGDLSLYVSGYCPYCMVVRRALSEVGVSVEERDVSASSADRAELRAATGRSTVPVLRIARDDGPDTWMPESQDIVRYIKRRFG